MGPRTETPGTKPPTKPQLPLIEPRPQPHYITSNIQEEATEELRDQRTNQDRTNSYYKLQRGLHLEMER